MNRRALIGGALALPIVAATREVAEAAPEVSERSIATRLEDALTGYWSTEFPEGTHTLLFSPKEFREVQKLLSRHNLMADAIRTRHGNYYLRQDRLVPDGAVWIHDGVSWVRLVAF